VCIETSARIVPVDRSVCWHFNLYSTWEHFYKTKRVRTRNQFFA